MKNIFLSILLCVITYSNGQTDTKLEASLDLIFSAYENQPGCAIAVVKKGKTIFQKGYGLANLSYNIPVTEKTVFDIGSNAQSITAACIFALEEKGQLSLQDPIQKYLPEIPTYGDTPITISNLLYHTSGLRSFYATLHAKNKFWGDSYTNSDAIQTIAKHKALNFPTGTKHYFSNSNYILLASIIEKVTRKSLGKYADETFFKPLGMTNTFFKEEKGGIIKNKAIGYSVAGGSFSQEYNNATVVGHGGLYTTLEDFIKWSNNLSSGIVGGNKLLKRLITQGKLANGKQIECTGGLFAINHNNIDNLPVVVHNWRWSGFSSFYYKFLDQDVAFIVLSNSENTNGWALGDQLIPLFLSETIEKATAVHQSKTNQAAIKPFQLTKIQKEKFVGSYYNSFNGYLRHIRLDGDKLMYERPGAPATPLMAISAHELVYESRPHVKFTFDKDDFQTFQVTINDGQPMGYQKYEKYTYTASELKAFEQTYYNEDIDGAYQLVALESELQIKVDGEEISKMQPIAKDMFTSDHSGYLKFQRDTQGAITGFIQYDDHLHGLRFKIRKKNQSEYSQIKKVLHDYIEGTANGAPDRVRNAFHKDLNLYSVKNDSLAIWFGKEYINGIKVGKKNSRQGKIISVDVENDAAIAKVEILIPGWRVFTDYFLLLKIQGNWKIIHKSYTWRNATVKS